MVKYVSLRAYHDNFLDQKECREGYLDEIEFNVLLNNVLFLTDHELNGILEVLEYIIEENLKELVEKFGKDEAVKKYSEQYYEPDIVNICSGIRGVTDKELLNEILAKSEKKIVPPIVPDSDEWIQSKITRGWKIKTEDDFKIAKDKFWNSYKKDSRFRKIVNHLKLKDYKVSLELNKTMLSVKCRGGEFLVTVEYPKSLRLRFITYLSKKLDYKEIDTEKKIEPATFGFFPIIYTEHDSDIEYLKKIIDYIYKLCK